MGAAFPAGLVFPINALPACQTVEQGIDTLCHDAELKAQAVLRYYQQAPADLLFCFSDIAIQAEAMGARLAYSPASLPVVVAPAPNVLLPRAAQVGRMGVNAQVLARLDSQFPGRLRAAMVYGPFTVAGQVAGEQEVLRSTVERPELVHALLEKTLALALDYARLLLETGAEVLWVSDPLASLLPPIGFWEFAGQYLARLLEVHAGPTALHICGDTSPIIGPMLQTGADGLSLDQCLDLLALEDALPPEVAIIGNLDPVEVLELTSPEDVAAQTNELVEVMGLLPNFCLSSGCAPPPTAPLANIASFLEAGRARWRQLAPHAQGLRDLAATVHAGQRGKVPALVSGLLEAGASPLLVLNSGLMRAIRKGSARYEVKQCHLPEILLMVDAFHQGFQQLEGRLGLAVDRPPQVVLGTVKGDVHEIGKNLVRIVLETQGVKVLDLGVNVEGRRFLEACQKQGVRVLGLSAFTTGARRELKKVIQLFRETGMEEVAVVVGGAAVNQQVAASVGADGYARDALAAARLVKGILARQGRAGRG
ncbi:MAG: cobalamin B12-binding domain-containing protein [Desulfarculus sp.]|nr:cobalamin B12-binding domain-containing protein [Desulfarculus sp.]